MAHTRSTVAVFNQALAWLGGEQLSSVETTWEESALGRLCKYNFPLVLDQALTAHDWSFARRRVTLPAKPESLPHPLYAKRYGLPADCLRPIQLLGSAAAGGGEYVIEGRDLLTNAAPAVLEYVAREEDPAAWPPEFAVALSWGLAAVLATAKINDPRKQEQCFQRYEAALAEAVARDLGKQRPRVAPSAWKAARFGG